MGDPNPNKDPQQSTSFSDAVSDTVTLAFKVVDNEPGDLPGQILKAMQSDDVQNAIKKALQEIADAQIKPKSGTPPPLPDPKDFLKKLVTAGGTAVEQNVLKQIKDTPRYKGLEKSLQVVLDTFKKTPIGVWFDKNEMLVYIIVGGIVLSGATAMYVTRSGSAVAAPAFDFVKDKQFKIVKLGDVVISASGTKFNPDKRELGAKVLASLNLKAVKVELSVTIQAADTAVQGSGSAKVVVPLGRDFVTTFSGTVDPTKKTVVLGLSLDATHAGVKVDLLATVQDGKLSSGSLNLGTNRSIVKGIDLRPGVIGTIDAHNGMSVMGTVGVSF
jgi:hypothetical protein